jgi:hypothetical protein
MAKTEHSQEIQHTRPGPDKEIDAAHVIDERYGRTRIWNEDVVADDNPERCTGWIEADNDVVYDVREVR